MMGMCRVRLATAHDHPAVELALFTLDVRGEIVMFGQEIFVEAMASESSLLS